MTEHLMEGILPVWKPEGFTSHDVVAKMRGILKMKRIGHTGTLDPQVTGVLPLCIGRATRLVEYIQELPKVYEATLRIGFSTDTEDCSGQVLEQVDRVALTEQQIVEAIQAFIGDIDQVPPMYSAVKVEGRRLYELARQGIQIERKSRTVTIYDIQVLEMALGLDHPEIKLRVKCSKGTYIRTLCVDIGRKLGYPSVMAHLVRTSTGNIEAAQCLTFEQIEHLQQQNLLNDHLIPVEKALAHMKSVQLDESQTRKALLGQKNVLRSDHFIDNHSLGAAHEQQLVTAFSSDSQFLGIFLWDQETSGLQPVKVFS